MADATNHTPGKIVYCRCAFAKVLPDGVKNGVLERLCASNAPFESVSDLCEMSARNDPRLKAIADSADGSPVKIAACYPRAVKWLFHAAGTPLPEGDQVEVVNLREEDVDSAMGKLLDETEVPTPAVSSPS